MDIATSPNTEIKRLKLFFRLLESFEIKHENFYTIDENYNILVSEDARIGDLLGTSSSIIKTPENDTLESKSKIEKAVMQFERDKKIAEHYLKVLNYVLNEQEKKVVLYQYFNHKNINLEIKKKKIYSILNQISQKMIIAWGFFFCDENGIIITADKIMKQIKKRREILKVVQKY